MDDLTSLPQPAILKPLHTNFTMNGKGRFFESYPVNRHSLTPAIQKDTSSSNCTRSALRTTAPSSAAYRSTMAPRDSMTLFGKIPKRVRVARAS